MQFDLLEILRTIPVSTVFIMLVAITLALVSIWATQRFTDMEKMKADMEEINAWRERFNKARKTMDPAELQQVMDDQGRIMRLQSSMMGARMKPMCVYYIPFLIIFGILNAIYGNHIVAIIPFNIDKVLPFISGWLGTSVPGGFGLSYYGYYFFVGLGLGNIIRRPFGLSMTT
ncbi:MAG: EMC3/TMCO1 family protein [Candidatus Thorarchaeota archaeon]